MTLSPVFEVERLQVNADARSGAETSSSWLGASLVHGPRVPGLVPEGVAGALAKPVGLSAGCRNHPPDSQIRTCLKDVEGALHVVGVGPRVGHAPRCGPGPR